MTLLVRCEIKLLKLYHPILHNGCNYHAFWYWRYPMSVTGPCYIWGYKNLLPMPLFQWPYAEQDVQRCPHPTFSRSGHGYQREGLEIDSVQKVNPTRNNKGCHMLLLLVKQRSLPLRYIALFISVWILLKKRYTDHFRDSVNHKCPWYKEKQPCFSGMELESVGFNRVLISIK